MRNTLFALILYGCASTRPAPARVPTFAGAFEDPPPPVMVWRALVRDALPAPIRAVAARSVDEAVVAAGGALFAVRGEGVVAPLCAREFFPGDEVSAVAVAGALLLAAGGDDDAPTLWRSDDGGTRCVRALLPSIGPAGRGAAPVRLTLVGEVAWLWSARGVLRSQDGGRRWMALPALSNVRRVFAGVGEETLAAVSDGPDEGERSVASHRGRLLRLDELDERAPRWRIVAEDRLLPMLGARRGDGAATLVDGEGIYPLDAMSRIGEGVWLPWSRTLSDAPRALVAASGDRFFASAGRLLFRVDAQGLHAMGTLPNDRPALRIDVAEDGALWAADDRSLWQGDFNGAWEERTRRPWSSARVVATAVAGPVVAIATEDGALSQSLDEGVRWTTTSLPPALGRVSAIGLGPRGAVLALGDQGMALGDGTRMVRIEGPPARATLSEAPGVFAVGDRWLVVRAGVWSSDDDGVKWVRRFGDDPEHTPDRGGPPRMAQDLVVVEGRALLLDAEFVLWRSDDAGETWRALRSLTPCPVAARPPWGAGRALLAWDGGERLAVLGRNLLARSDDAGRTWRSADAPFGAAAARMDPNGALVVAIDRPGSARLCLGAIETTLAVARGEVFTLARDACAHRGAAVAFEARRGGDVVVVSPAGAAWRAAIDALPEPDGAPLF